MVHIPGGTFKMGFEHGHDDERPIHAVTLKPFFLDRHEVTNRQFTTFVEQTGYVTQAERNGYSWCFLKGADDFQTVAGADWRHPEGEGSSIRDRMDHPVVNVSWKDALAYARWAGKRLPTEAEWEYAVRAGGKDHVAARMTDNVSSGPISNNHNRGHSQHSHTRAYVSGALHPSYQGHASAGNSHHPRETAGSESPVDANVWQGTWPYDNQLKDGFFYTAPVESLKPNASGIYDMVGNVWEWTADWYAADYYSQSLRDNPTGPSSGDKRVARGGSWFCSPNYCAAYNSHYRGASPPDHTFNNVGFRCAVDVPAGGVSPPPQWEEK